MMLGQNYPQCFGHQSLGMVGGVCGHVFRGFGLTQCKFFSLTQLQLISFEFIDSQIKKKPMGGCISYNKGSRSKTQCKYCSNPVPQQRHPSATQCHNGHTVCELCMTKADDSQFHCPHCQVKVQSKPAEPTFPPEEIKPNKIDHNVKVQQHREEQVPRIIQHYSVLNEQQNHHPIVDQAIVGAVHQKPIKEEVAEPMKKTLFQQDKKPEQNQQALLPAKPTAIKPETAKAEEKPFQKKVCGCALQNFFVVIVLIVQTLFTAGSMYYSLNQPKSECMDVSHASFLPPMRPLMQQISGVETAITFIMIVSAFIYKRGCLSEPIFDNWMIFLKFILSTKQLLWTAIQTMLQMVVMPLYCDRGIMRFTLITSIGNLVSFLLVILKPVYTCLSEKCCCAKKEG